MKSQYLASVALAGLAAAQSSSNISLADALGSQNDTLSTLNGLLQGQSDLVQLLSGANNITILAPSNDAFEEFLDLDGVAEMIESNPDIVTALLTYHVLNGTYYASNITDEAAFVPTLLTNQTYTNVTGGQVVEAINEDGDVSFISALRVTSNVDQANLNFTGGTIHIVDHVLSIPMNLTDTAVQANLSAVVGAITTADLGTTLDEARNITVFAPNNAAFSEIGSITGNLSTEQLSGILAYHVIEGTIAYSSLLSNASIETLAGNDVNITVTNNTVYVNEARVLIPDILIANGVVHVIDGVLNPNNTESSNPTNTEPAFSGASSVSDVPFTSDVPTATGRATGLETASTTIETSTSEEGGVPMATGAIAMGALFGGAAALLNGM